MQEATKPQIVAFDNETSHLFAGVEAGEGSKGKCVRPQRETYSRCHTVSEVAACMKAHKQMTREQKEHEHMQSVRNVQPLPHGVRGGGLHTHSQAHM